MAPLVRVPRTLPTILDPSEVDRLIAAVRTRRERSMVRAMVLGGLRRCEVLRLRLGDLDVAKRKVLIVEGKGGHQQPSHGQRLTGSPGTLNEARIIQ